MLIKNKINQSTCMQRKVIKNITTYDLNLHNFEHKISKRIRLDDNRKIKFKTLPLTSNFNYKFPMLRIKKNRIHQMIPNHKTPTHSHEKIEIHLEPTYIERINNREKVDLVSAVRLNLNSVIVANHKKSPRLTHADNSIEKQRSSNNIIRQSTITKEGKAMETSGSINL